MLQMYTVVVEENGTKHICFDGRTPVLGDKAYCQRQANFLKESFPNNEYVIHKVTPLKAKGKVRDY